MKNGAEIVAYARSFIGTRWVHQGRTRDGLDCAGLVIRVAQDLGYSTFDTTDYARQATDETMLELCRAHLAPVPLGAIEPGDVLVFAFENQRHMGLVGDYPVRGELSLIHAYALGPRRVVEVRLDPVWMGRALGAFRSEEHTSELQSPLN